MGGLGIGSVELRAGEIGSRKVTPQSFQIRNKKFGDLLRPEDANGADGTRIVLYPAQPWKCMTWKLHPAGETLFQVQNHFTTKTFAADSKAAGSTSAVAQIPFSREFGERPAWRFTKLPDGFYQIIEVKSGKALTAVPAAGGGARVVVGPLAPSDDQKWELIKTDPSKLTM